VNPRRPEEERLQRIVERQRRGIELREVTRGIGQRTGTADDVPEAYSV
jgi:hypothetical protein